MAEVTSAELFSKDNVIAEAIFFLFKTGEALLEPTVRLSLATGVCYREFQNETSICFDLGSYPDKENHVQAVAATYLAYYKLILNLPALMLAAFCGSWSDTVGRKLPIVMSSFGTIVAVVFYMASLVMLPYSPWSFLILVFVAAAVRGLFGKSTVMTMAVHSYVADVSSKKARTEKLSKLLSMNYFGYFFGSLLTGALLQLTDFAYVFTAVIIVNGACVFITIYCMRESVPLQVINGTSEDVVIEAEEEPPKNWKSSYGIRATFVTIIQRTMVFNMSNQTNYTNSFSLGTPQGVGQFHHQTTLSTQPCTPAVLLRLDLHPTSVFFVALIFIQQACKSGEVDITVLYTAKSPLRWSESTYGYLLAVDYAFLGLSSAFLLPGLVQCFNLGDLTLCAIGVVFKIGRLVMLAYGKYTWLIFLSVIIGSPSALVISSAKSMISKFVCDDEMGKTFALLSCGETVANLIGSLAFTGLYATTVHVYPGLAFAVDAGLMGVILIGVLLIICDVRHLKNTGDGDGTQSYASLYFDDGDGTQSYAFLYFDDGDGDNVTIASSKPENLVSYGTMEIPTNATTGRNGEVDEVSSAGVE